MEKEFKQTIKVDCPYCREYNGVVMCMDYVIPCKQNVARSKCKVTEVYTKLIEASLAGYMDDIALYGRVTDGLDDIELTLHQKIMLDQFMERVFDRLLYGSDLKYAPARHLVKGVAYGNEDLPRAGLCIKNIGQIKEK